MQHGIVMALSSMPYLGLIPVVSTAVVVFCCQAGCIDIFLILFAGVTKLPDHWSAMGNDNFKYVPLAAGEEYTSVENAVRNSVGKVARVVEVSLLYRSISINVTQNF